MTKLAIYTASKVSYSPLWLRLRSEWPEFDWTAHWPENIGHVPETPENAVKFWDENISDIMMSNVVLVYAPYGDILRGALVEAGAGLAFGLQVVVCGQSDSFGTWQYHPNCRLVKELDEARAELGLMALKLRETSLMGA